MRRPPQRLTPGFARRGGVAAGCHAGLDPVVVDPAVHPQSFEDRAEFGDRLVGAGDDLAGDWRTFGGVAVCGEFPGQVEAVLDRGVGAMAVLQRMPVGCIAHDEDAVLLQVGGEAVVHRSAVGGDPLDFPVRHPDQLAGDLGWPLRRQRRGRAR